MWWLLIPVPLSDTQIQGSPLFQLNPTTISEAFAEMELSIKSAIAVQMSYPIALIDKTIVSADGLLISDLIISLIPKFILSYKVL